MLLQYLCFAKSCKCRTKVGGRSDGRYNFFVCHLLLAKEPLPVKERLVTGGKRKVVVKEVRKPFPSSLRTRERREVTRCT